MKLISRLFFVMVLLVVFATGSLFAQAGAAGLATDGIIALAGRGREKKQEKIIDQSTTQEKIGTSNITVLRVKDSDIKSKAKAHIIALQNRLNLYATQYKNNQLINIPKNDSDLTAIQNIDENWPTEYYTNELRAYKRYDYQQKQKMPAAPADVKTVPANAVKKDSASGT